MTSLLLRGRLLSFHRAPESLTDTASYLYEEDGGLLVQDGRIARMGSYSQVKAAAPEGVEEVDHRPHLILPGLIDICRAPAE